MLPTAAPLSDWLMWLETLSPTEIDLGLERVRLVLGRLELPRPEQLLLIAGTNGKGSSVAMADALLRACGQRVGAYTSPHVHRYNERIIVNGAAADDATIIAAFEAIEAVRGDTELTYFEFGTLAAAIIFASADLDVWILEVGLGGRLDACNAFEATVSLISNVSLDHCDWLGRDVESIAAEKAGVMRRGVCTVFGDSEVPAAIKASARSSGAILLLADRDFEFHLEKDGKWNWRGPSGDFRALLPPGLAGEFQIRNAAAVLAMLDVVGLADSLDAERINAVLPNIRLMGRSQYLTVDALDGDEGAGLERGDTQWIIDVAHNPAAAKMLARTLRTSRSADRTIAIIGLLQDKDVAGVVGLLAEQVQQWITITPDSHRAVAADELARQISSITGADCHAAESPADAIELARHCTSENDRILVTGSFYTVAPVLELLTAISRPKT